MGRMIEIDAANFGSRKETHDYLRKQMKSEDYIGSNLDALYDVLTSLGRGTVLELRNIRQGRENAGTYADSVLRVMKAAEEDNPNLTVLIHKSVTDQIIDMDEEL